MSEEESALVTELKKRTKLILIAGQSLRIARFLFAPAFVATIVTILAPIPNDIELAILIASLVLMGLAGLVFQCIVKPLIAICEFFESDSIGNRLSVTLPASVGANWLLSRFLLLIHRVSLVKNGSYYEILFDVQMDTVKSQS